MLNITFTLVNMIPDLKRIALPCATHALTLKPTQPQHIGKNRWRSSMSAKKQEWIRVHVIMVHVMTREEVIQILQAYDLQSGYRPQYCEWIGSKCWLFTNDPMTLTCILTGEHIKHLQLCLREERKECVHKIFRNTWVTGDDIGLR